jgi:hypothetical protein
LTGIRRRSRRGSAFASRGSAAHPVGEQQRDPRLNAAVRAGIERLRAGYEALACAAQERGELDPGLEPEHLGRLCISLLLGLVLQVGVYGDAIDIDGYARTATLRLDRECRSRRPADRSLWSEISR